MEQIYARFVGGAQELDTNNVRFVGVVVAVCTNFNCIFPWLLLERSWHGNVPSLGHMAVTDRTKSDLHTTEF